ncbi:hypothetical protein B0T24DRAFT_526717 [Lasiosphaeria ovina]|uniref:NAD-dependent epimerase/dehydratase domain-containing protein n=1 Tax=Lasiosphaeria ovina TaxID=92902 RepID=A0AAE0KH73_9PEZI|nr:hypothetical protein B0T24DRAFT_526717 [Lasiosphaeria ovina]
MASPSEQTLLVTGGTSFVAGHIIKQALDKGYHVRTTARSESSLAKVRATFAAHGDKLTTAAVADITKPELYEAAFASPTKPITGVLSVASPFVLQVDDNARDLLQPAIGGGLAVLEATRRFGPAVRRVVETSSFASNLDLAHGARAGYTYTAADWNPMTYEQAVSAPAGAAYCASKALAEKAMWDWVAAEKPSFSLIALNPAWVFGPHVDAAAVADPAKLNTSSATLHALLGAAAVPPFDFGGFVDVRVLAAAQIAAFETDAAAGRRFIVASHFDYQSAVDALRAALPEIRDRVPEGTPGDVPVSYAVDGSEVETFLGVKYIPLGETMRDSFAQFLEAEKHAPVAASA